MLYPGSVVPLAMFILLAPVGPSLFFKVPIFNSIWVRIFKLLVPVIIRIMRRMISILFSKILEICSERYEITNDHWLQMEDKSNLCKPD